MRRHQIRGIERPASVLCLGALPFSILDDDQGAFAILDAFVAGGGNFLDTALVYGEWVPTGNGASERVLGRWMRSRANRDQLVIGTKGGHPSMTTMDVPRLTPADIEHDVSQSLKNLKIDHIDLYWLHRDNPLQPVDSMLGALEREVERGRISAYGCSNWSLPRIEQAQEVSQQSGYAGFAANQASWSLAAPNGNQADRDPSAINRELVDYHLTTQLPLATFGSMAGGYFNKLGTAESHTVRQSILDRYDNPTNIARLARLQQGAKALDTSLAALQVAALTTQPFPTFAIVGVSSVRHVTEAVPGGGTLATGTQAQAVLKDLNWPDFSSPGTPSPAPAR